MDLKQRKSVFRKKNTDKLEELQCERDRCTADKRERRQALREVQKVRCDNRVWETHLCVWPVPVCPC